MKREARATSCRTAICIFLIRRPTGSFAVKPDSQWPVDDLRGAFQPTPHSFAAFVGDASLNNRLAELCLVQEDTDAGIRASNRGGGFHSRALEESGSPALADLVSAAAGPLRQLLRKKLKLSIPFPSFPPRAKAGEIWCNVNRGGAYNHLHNHQQFYAAAAVYFVASGFRSKVSGYPARFRIQTDIGQRGTGSGRYGFVENNSSKEVLVEAVPGRLVIFPPDVYHGTEVHPGEGALMTEDPSACNGARVSIALNLYARWPETSLQFASGAGHASKVEKLLRKRANPNKRSARGWNAVHHAVDAGHIPVLNYLVDARANLNQPILPSQVSADANRIDDGHVPLVLAATNSKLAVFLLAKRADPQAADGLKGWGALHMAAFEGLAPFTALLLDEGRIPVDDPAPQTGAPALHLAASNGFGNVVRVLISKRASAISTDSYDVTPLHHAAGNGHVVVARLLMRTHKMTSGFGRNGSVNLEHVASAFQAREINGYEPLHIAAMKGHLPMVELLVCHGAVQPQHPDSTGSTARQLAMKAGHDDIAMFLKHGSCPRGFPDRINGRICTRS